MTLRIRRATPHDHDSILEMAPRLTAGVAPWREAEAVTSAVSKWVEDALLSADDENHALFVAELDDQVVGFISAGEQAHWAGDVDAYIGELVVSASASRRGIGAALVQKAMEWGRMSGYKRVLVSTGAANTAACALYRSLGFEGEDVSFSAAL